MNMGIGAALEKGALEDAAKDLALITGRKAAISKSRRSIANFKLREGQADRLPCHAARERAYEFLDRLLSIAIPRIRDFRGLKATAFDGRGNYSLGVREQIIFPEIDYDSVDHVRGLDVTITTSAQTDVEAFELLLAFGMPFTKERRPGAKEAAARARAAADGRSAPRRVAREGRGRAGCPRAAQGRRTRGLREAGPEPKSRSNEETT